MIAPAPVAPGIAVAGTRAAGAPDRTARLHVDAEGIARNTRVIRARAGVPLMAVLKADGFGHGAAARVALQNGAASLGVASIPEALALRGAGIEAPILSWLNPLSADFDAAVAAAVDLGAPSLEHLFAIAASARRAGRTARVHLHIDVGMTRDGAPAESWSPLCVFARALEQHGWIRVAGVMGHLSHAETPEHRRNTVERLLFRNAIRVARGCGLAPPALHLAATAAALHLPGCRFTLCRVGAGLYGIDPAGRAPLTPALTLTAPVVQRRAVRAGSGVGYGHEHTTSRATTLALLPIGYADGLPRSAQGRAEVSIRGRRMPVVGRISMDQIVVDAGSEPVSPGDVAVIMGPGTAGEPTVREWADWAGTIAHEIVTRLGVRTSRVERRSEGSGR